MERLHLALALPVEVPPTGPVRDEVQVAGRAPRGLEDRLLARPAGDLPHVLKGGVISEFRHIHLGSVPGHPGEIPLEPAEHRAIGGDPG
jgi:hypothetical protein